MRILYIIGLLLSLAQTPIQAQDSQTAHSILLKTLNLIQNPGGAQLDYRLKVAIYSKHGHVVFKGNKFKRESSKTIDWFDGKTYWTLSKSSNVCKIHLPKKQTDQNLASMMNAVRTGCEYRLADEGKSWRIRIKSLEKKSKLKEAEVIINKANYAPMMLRVKLGFIWANIVFSQFRTGNYPDSMFYFDPRRYPNVKVVDKR